MTKLSKEAESVLEEFKQAHKAEPELYKKLRDTIDGNSAISEQINHAVKLGTLKHITNDAPNGVGAQYDPSKSTIQLNADTLKNSTAKDNLTLVFQFGHELKHAENKTATAASQADFQTTISSIAQQKDSRDYTAPLNKVIAANRQDEAQAHIAGWNAAMAQAKITNPKITAQQLSEKTGYGVHFFDPSTNKPLPGITVEKDGTIKSSAENVEAVGKSYFDMPANRANLGPNKVDYRNYYAASYISNIASNEAFYSSKHSPHTYASVDMSKAGLNQNLLQKAGLQITSSPLNLVDTSDHNHPRTMHLYDGSAVPPGKKPIQSDQPVTPSRAAPATDDPFTRLTDAAMNRDGAGMRAAGQEFRQSDAGQQWLQSGREHNQEVAQQAARALQQAQQPATQPAEPAQTGPVMR